MAKTKAKKKPVRYNSLHNEQFRKENGNLRIEQRMLNPDDPHDKKFAYDVVKYAPGKKTGGEVVKTILRSVQKAKVFGRKYAKRHNLAFDIRKDYKLDRGYARRKKKRAREREAVEA